MEALEITYKPYGDRAILMQWPNKIDEKLLEYILFCKESLEKKYYQVILEVISSYNSILIFYRTTIENFYTTISELKDYISDLMALQTAKKMLWHIPVCYDSKMAVDLEVYCQQKKMSKTALIALHSDVVYTVYFIGFLPGFLYLGGLSKLLHIPRKKQPSLKVPKGAVAIGGQQTGIYPQDSPGGWYVIGQCPVSFFDAKSTMPCFINPGDKIQFRSVSVSEYNAIGSLVNAGVYLPNGEIYEG